MMNKIRFVEEKTDSSAENIKEWKQQLRAYMKERRGQNENRDVKEMQLLDNFFQWWNGETNGACTRRTVFCYLSFSSEAPTDTLVERLKELGAAVCCPRIENGDMSAVLYGEDFCLSDYGIREPIGENFQGEVDVIVLPLLAVDKQGNRLGYGKGYYDRYLKAHPAAKRVAYCYDFQICNNVPSEVCDEKVDIIITDKKVLYINHR